MPHNPYEQINDPEENELVDDLTQTFLLELKDWIKVDVRTESYQDLFWSKDWTQEHTQTKFLCRKMALAAMEFAKGSS